MDALIDVVTSGGSVSLGIDVYNDKDMLLLDRGAIVKNVDLLLKIKAIGITEVPFNPESGGGLWDRDGKRLNLPDGPSHPHRPSIAVHSDGLKKRIQDIHELKILAAEKYAHAKSCIKTVITDIKKTGGEFDFQLVEKTVSGILDFLIENENGFSYLTKEIFSYDDYLYNHSINVCTIATAALQKFNSSMSSSINNTPGKTLRESIGDDNRNHRSDHRYFTPQEIRTMSTAFFLHDVGKVLIPERILNKKGPLRKAERDLVQRHSYEKGAAILNKNRISDPIISAVIKFHHSAIYPNEPDAYPSGSPSPENIPIYVKISKLADIFDAMTAKRCYKDAQNPVAVVYGLFHRYAGKDNLLQLILHSFVKTVGIYPAGSVITLKNGQQVYVIDSNGPVVLPFTDPSGSPLRSLADPIDLEEAEKRDPFLVVDRHTELISPIAAYEHLPQYLRHELVN